ncbi:helix-turn-helix transcriptional regulator [Alicyclobacillus macrosporangiidus]|jgi:putative transcriptional regulator|uniref:DNA-binding transcriptional regulator, XRE-family HTH domain n=1 Tax=Alicyclobacillus macrosporangiidus TaxID=392015 RepID=A0A1I7FXD8_9BACL|nr:helix-turn-helix domain-containing protein [Alicyclobacillus macrosporangiidus]SFU40830.1 DNA-binding transcriptional regulator, XRE-family HTH domain [Alicyclobacillus macrosporangiidus]
MAVRNRLKELRHDNRMNQTEFAELLGVNRQLYNRWERQVAQPSVEWVLRISAKLGVPMEQIVYLDDSEPN